MFWKGGQQEVVCTAFKPCVHLSIGTNGCCVFRRRVTKRSVPSEKRRGMHHLFIPSSPFPRAYVQLQRVAVFPTTRGFKCGEKRLNQHSVYSGLQMSELLKTGEKRSCALGMGWGRQDWLWGCGQLCI